MLRISARDLIRALDEKLNVLISALDLHQLEHGNDLVSHNANSRGHVVARQRLENVSADEELQLVLVRTADDVSALALSAVHAARKFK